MDVIDNAVVWFNERYGYVLIVLLVGAGLWWGVRTRVVQLRLLPDMVRAIREQPPKSKAGGTQISAFRAFCISAASRVGTGNVAGVAVAITIGGPGAVFWMWVLAIIGGATAFVESTLGQLYKVRDGADYRGGPAYYLSRGIKNRRLAFVMSLLFAVAITFTYGFVFNSVQSNSITAAVDLAVGSDAAWVPYVIGATLATLTALVIFGGVHRISGVSQVLVPIMAITYVGLAFFIVATNLGALPGVIGDIVNSAFGVREFVGGGLWAVIMQGMRRGLFSNEAGMGSTPNAAATAAVSHPAKQGLVQTLGVYFDTLIVCSATAFIILLSNPDYGSDIEGVQLTQTALAHHIGSWAGPLLAVILFFLAFSSVIGNYYYGETNIAFFTRRRWVLNVFRVAVIGFVFFGAITKVSLVWNLADVFSSLMATVNIVGLFLIGGVAVLLLRNFTAQRARGLDPVFHRDDIPGLTGVECWDGTDPETVRDEAPEPVVGPRA
ncbi:sodium:alanine symporter family protein [Gordonia sp. (in: high G+C Gram-positive bacteria)]|uniref:alanine/glycine:cation symporter family protein n=1 Tax=Gordonia sp. (in: high G+C Gram-positive bacteria) TaxID=84139 RepID=UPI0016B78E67|nr:alanine/glycine:cation symporter family protein [Gordonia sp. (in: high G+C Gram-positive bacteria)]NLG47276.1 alanine:cation symporter family protein [Gordonia sp. (in: high G+C Gram-positive bacteria)]